ncbi:hypothetical protein SAPIO_CDS6190 [Scedosporium apiospermum]|uniref:Uncharacterized protein n=1 Tax=Pseudallescheria apiosperma TaxID=563466 RepID=A0A084G478_PSEDA|nr:uncharacterized protein SAPIO_CDS6190 [Scedosporium apiospermum]KEZ42140.1 hypothetical protein SAPIO_CDS6190 [Scedosporium apiospermum]
MARIFLSLISALFGTLAIASIDCRPNGPVVPRPTDLANSQVVTSALGDLTNLLQQAVDGDVKGSNLANSSFSVALISFSQQDAAIPIWEFHHLSPANVNGTKNLDRDSQYLIGSVSKVFTDLVLLKSGIDPDTPVREYLPSLEDGRISWRDITLKALGNNLAGTPAIYGFSEYYYIKEVFELLGFPPLNNSEFPECGVIGLNSDCDAQGLLRGLLDSYPVSLPAQSPVYSSLGYSLLAIALKEATGKNYTQLLDELDPSTSLSASHGKSSAPPNHPHVVDVYGKGGGSWGYLSQLNIIDEYGIAFVVLTAGAAEAMYPISDAVLATVVPAVDEAARQQAEKYTGLFSGEANGVVVNATVELDSDSIVIRSLYRDGHDMLAGIQEIFKYAYGDMLGLRVETPRLFPTGIEEVMEVAAEGCDSAISAIREDWRLTWSDFTLLQEPGLPAANLSTQTCLSWSGADWVHYGKQPLDRFVFVRDKKTGDLLGFEAPFLRSGLLQKVN